jgi:hypothetical protein
MPKQWPMLQSDSIASASVLKRSEAMFDSIRNWLTRADRHEADRRALEAEARQFRLPGEMLPQVFKYLFFAGLGFLNSDAVRYYSRVVAFPLLAGLLGLSVVAITMAHPKNIVRLRQAWAHTVIAIGRAEAASELQLMRAQSVVEQARLDRQRERTRRESEYLAEVEKLIAVEERKRQMIGAISDANLREALARDLGVDSQPNQPARRPGFVSQDNAPKKPRNWI